MEAPVRLTDVAVKDVRASRPYSMDWSAWLTGESDTLSTASVTVSPAGDLTVLSDPAVNIANGVVTWWLSGGLRERSYTVTVQVDTAGGRRDARAVQVLCRDR